MKPKIENRKSELLISEVFHSIQGESMHAGQPCVFVRLAGCHLRCNYCDTEYAFHGGERSAIGDVVARVRGYDCDLVEVTGGEPLLQQGVHDLMRLLCDAGKTVLLETSGACDISMCDPRVIRIMDIKTPDSGEVQRNLWSNMDHLTSRDEIKFVIGSRADYEWSRDVLREYHLNERVAVVLFSPVHVMPPGNEVPGAEGLSLHDLGQWVLEDGLPVRIQVQLHKLIWDPMARGV